MAKLSARGRTELFRLTKDYPRPDQGKYANTLAVMSDGTVLSKNTFYTAEGKVDHSTGWRREGTLRKHGIKLEMAAEQYKHMKIMGSGYRIVSK